MTMGWERQERERYGGGSVCARHACRSEVRESVPYKVVGERSVCKGAVCKSGVCVCEPSVKM